MINQSFINAQLTNSKLQRESTPFLRQFVFRVVDQALTEAYGNNYSTKCLQSSFAIKQLLDHFGIQNKVFIGAVCMSKATRGNPFQLGWSGFWGEDHHVWLATEFYEFVDLTISQLHLHPATKTNDEPIPAIWWHTIEIWPPIIKYLPDAVVKPALPPQEMEELEHIKKRVLEIKNEIMASCHESETLFSPILLGMDHIQKMTEEGYPWLVKSLTIQDRGIPCPEWVVKREQELTNLATRNT